MLQSKPNLRRNGRPQACEPCRKSKHRCDHSSPICSRCIVLGAPDLCVYHPAPMTKVRGGSVANLPTKLLHLLPAPQGPRSVQTTPSVSPLVPETLGPTLFQQPGSRYAMVNVSAIFRENQDQIGAELLNVEEEGQEKEEPKTGRRNHDDLARMKLALGILHAFPSPQTCQYLSIPMAAIHDVTMSPKMISHCLGIVWTTYGNALAEPVSKNKLSKMANDLFDNGNTAPHLDINQAWVNWFCGPSLRWEMIGMLFCAFGLSMMRLQDLDPVFDHPRWHGHSRKTVSRKMKECAEACLSLRNRDHARKDVIHCLVKNTTLLHNQISADEFVQCHFMLNGDDLGDDLAMYEGRGVATYIEAGLHCLVGDGPTEPRSEYMRAISASGYRGEISGALFNARPPTLSRFYCILHLPLDLTQDQWYGSPENLAAAVSRLDESGWNSDGNISTVTWLRARCLLVPIREEILEISYRRDMKADPVKVNHLVEKLSVTTSSYPPWLQYPNIRQWSLEPFTAERNKNFYIVTRIQCEALQTRFLIQRLRHPSSVLHRPQELFNVAQELLEVTLSLWIERDRLVLYQNVFHWLVVDFGIPAAGVLCVELLYALRHPQTKDQILMSRSRTIQSLTMFVAFLGWIRPGDGNYKLCKKFMKVIRNILDYVLDAPRISPHLELNDMQQGISGLAEDAQSNMNELNFDESDWLNLLSTMDWTQSFAPY